MSSIRTITGDDCDDWRVPADVMGPFLPVSAHDIDVFNEILGDEIDSSFASSICCCDSCYDDFCARWPGVAFRDMEFQTQSMEAFWCVEYSRLPGIYSPAEISTLRHFVRCPRCGDYIRYNLWVYEHRFSSGDELETEIHELLAIGSATPFLLLEHSLAQRVLSAVRSCADNCTRITIDKPMYRSRTVDAVVRLGQLPNDIETYAAPPAAHVGEGRFNHAGSPMLYLADAQNTALVEIGTPGHPCHVARIRVRIPLKVLDLVGIDEGEPNFDLFAAIANSALLSAPRTGDGWLKKQYVFSRFVADCARSAGFDAIRYGSTKAPQGTNYVLVGPQAKLGHIADLEGVETLVCPPAAVRY